MSALLVSFFVASLSQLGSPTSPVANSSYSIVAAGQCQGKLLFLTASADARHLLAYQFPLAALDPAANRLHTDYFSPVPVKTKWPPLGLALHRSTVLTAVTVQDPKGEDFLFAVRDSREDGRASVFFDFTLNQFFVVSTIAWDGNLWLSSTEPYHFFVLRQTAANLSLAKYSFTSTQSDDANLVYWQNIQAETNFLMLCLEERHSIALRSNGCHTYAHWNVTSGLAAKERFYFFGPHTMYSFDGLAFNSSETTVRLYSTSLAAFFGNDQATTVTIREHSSTAVHSVGLTIALVLGPMFLLFLIGLTIYLSICCRHAHHHHHHHHKPKHVPLPLSTKKCHSSKLSQRASAQKKQPPSSIAQQMTKLSTKTSAKLTSKVADLSKVSTRSKTHPSMSKPTMNVKSRKSQAPRLVQRPKKSFSLKHMPTTRSSSGSEHKSTISRAKSAKSSTARPSSTTSGSKHLPATRRPGATSHKQRI